MSGEKTALEFSFLHALVCLLTLLWPFSFVWQSAFQTEILLQSIIPINFFFSRIYKFHRILRLLVQYFFLFFSLGSQSSSKNPLIYVKYMVEMFMCRIPLRSTQVPRVAIQFQYGCTPFLACCCAHIARNISWNSLEKELHVSYSILTAEHATMISSLVPQAHDQNVKIFSHQTDSGWYFVRPTLAIRFDESTTTTIARE